MAGAKNGLIAGAKIGLIAGAKSGSMSGSIAGSMSGLKSGLIAGSKSGLTADAGNGLMAGLMKADLLKLVLLFDPNTGGCTTAAPSVTLLPAGAAATLPATTKVMPTSKAARIVVNPMTCFISLK